MKRGFPVYACVFSLACGALAPLVAAATAPEVAQQPFDHYQTILDRMPFGPLPPDFGAAEAEPAAGPTDAQVQAEQQKLAKQVNMSCINVTPDGTTAIGFTDLAQKPPLNFYLLVGAEAGGWRVVAADYDEEWAQLEKEGVTITLKLGAGLIEAPPAPAAAAVSDATKLKLPAPSVHTAATLIDETTESLEVVRPGLIKRPSLGGRASVNTVSLYKGRAELDKVKLEIDTIRKQGGDVVSYMERLRERKAQEKAEKDAAEKAAREKMQELARKITEDELKKREREINLNLIEQGARPISDIELTPEEEEALVQRGVLAQ